MADLMNISYDTSLGKVELDKETVFNYLVKGNGKVDDKEIVLFMKMCEAQKLNPFATGECYLIKYSDKTPAQMVVGYDTYKRRAEDHPEHLYYESGITVLRGENIVQKRGACLYPSEQLIGGWCTVHKERNGKEVQVFKEVALSEYDQKQSIWKDKPCMMIEKVAISQCLREAYPKDFEGLYTEAELGVQVPKTVSKEDTGEVVDVQPVVLISQEQRENLFKLAHSVFGKDDGNTYIKNIMNGYNISSTVDIPVDLYNEIVSELEKCQQQKNTKE